MSVLAGIARRIYPLLSAASVTLFLSVSAQAQVRPAVGVSSNQRPSIRSSSNGTPVVEITAPDKHGVSDNKFDSFNVDSRGLILNNDFLPGRSSLGGLVKHNPNFGWGDFARLIIDQVVGAGRPSALDGPVEVFGPRADLLIANPNGISVNGAEFHNISRLTLSAGTVQYDRHGNVGLSIDTGNLEIGSGGLHVVTIDDVTVLGRNIILNGPVESGYLLSLFSGKRYFDYKSRTSSGTGAKGNGKWGIDSSALGGVSAGRIIMESTDHGVGVRAPRRMAASAGDVTITADGRIRLGQIRSNGRIYVHSASGNIVQRGNAIATGAVVYQAAGKIKNQGTIQSGSDVELQSTDLVNNGSILSNAAIWIYATGSAQNNGRIQGDTGVGAQLGSLRNLGSIISGGIVNLETSNGLANSGVISASQGLAMVNQASAIEQTGYLESALGPVEESSGGGLTESGALLVNKDLVLQSNSFLTVTGSIVATGAVNLSAAGVLTLGNIQSGGRLLAESTGGDILQLGNAASNGMAYYSAAGKIDIRGSLISGSFIEFQSSGWSNEGKVLTNGAVLINGTGTGINNGQIEGDLGVAVQMGALRNLGSITSAGVVTAQSVNGLANTGTILGNQGVSLMNQSGDLLQNGTVGSANGDLIELSGGSLTQIGSTLASGRAILRSGGDLNVNGTVIANGGLNLIGAGDVTFTGIISTRGDLVAAAGQDLQNKSEFTVGGAVDLSAQGALSSTQRLNAGGNLYVSAQNVELDQGAASGAGLQITAAGGDFVTRGLLSASQNLIIAAKGNIVTAQTVTAGGDLGVEAGGSITATGTWAAGGNLALIAAGSFTEPAGLSGSKIAVQVGGDMHLGGSVTSLQTIGLWIGGNLDTRASFAANGAVGLNVQGNLTSSGSIRSGDTVSLSTGANLVNSGVITAGGQARLVGTETVTNNGAIASNDGILIQTQNGLLTNTGNLTSFSDIVVSSGAALNNAGSIASRGNVELDSVTLLTNNGNAQITGVLSLLSQQDLANTGRLAADSGIQLVAAQGSITNHGILENNTAVGQAAAGQAMVARAAMVGRGSARAAELRGDPIQTSSGGIQLTAGANLTNMADLSTTSDLVLHAGNDLSSSAALTALGKADIAAGGNLSLSGSLVAGDDIQALAAGSATLQGTIQSSAGIAIQAGTDLSSSAVLSAGTDIALMAGHDVVLAPDPPTASASSPGAPLTVSLIQADHNVAISAQGSAINQGVIEAGNILQVEAGVLDNSGGKLISNGDITLALNSSLTNSSGSVSTARNINISVTSFSGPGGVIQSGWDTVISAQNWDNDQAQLLAGRSLQLSIDSGSDRSGTISAGSTSSGALRLGDLVIDSAGAFDNSGGTLSATRHVILNSAGFDNASGKIVAATGDLAWIVNGTLNNTGGSVQAGHNLEVSTQGDLNNSSGTINVTGDSQYAVQGTVINQGGSIATGNNLALNAVSLNNRQGRITAGTDIARFNIQSDADNTGGAISAGGLFQGQIGGTFTQGGTLAGNGQVQLEVQNLENSGSIASAGAVQILAGSLGNQGAIQGDLGVILHSASASFSSESTIESYYGPVQIAVDSALTNQGAMTTNQDIVLQIGGAFTNQGNIVAGNNVQIVAAGQIENDQLVSAGRDLEVSAVDSQGNLYQIINKGGSFIAGNDARFDTSYFTNTTSGGVAIDTGWQHVAVLYPYGTRVAKWHAMPSGDKGMLAFMLNNVYERYFNGNASIVSAGHDLVINSANGGINQASTIVAGNTVTLLGAWENQSEGTYFGKNWLEVFEAANGHGTQSLNGNDRYRPVGVPGGDRSAETDIEVIGDGWNFGSGVWQFVESPYFAWNPQRSGPSQSPWTYKDAIFPGKIDGRDAHDFFGVTDSLKLQFVITSNPPTNDVNHIDLQDQPGRQGVIDGLAGTNVSLADNDFGEPIGANGYVVTPSAPTAALSGLGQVAEPRSNPLPGALSSVPDLSLAAHALSSLPQIAPPVPGQASTGITANTIPRGSIVVAIVPVTTQPLAPLIASSGTVSAAQTSIPTIPLVSAQAPIRADVSQVVGSDPNFQIQLDASPQIVFPDFDSYWVQPSNAPIELSPELRALLAQDPIPDRSRIQALDHLLGKAFSTSALLAWAHNLKPAVSAPDPGRSIAPDVKGISLASGYATRAQWLAALKTVDLAENVKGLFAGKSLLANLTGPVPHGVTLQTTLSRPDFLKMAQQHQAWIAKNDPGFYSWQHKVEQQVQKKIDAEEHGNSLVGMIVGAVAAVVLAVVFWYAAPVIAAGFGSVFGTATIATSAVSASTVVISATATSATVLSTVGAIAMAVVEGAVVGFASGFTATLIGTGDLGKAAVAGGLGALVGAATAGILRVPIVSDIANNIGSAIQPAFTLVTKTATDALNAAASFAGQIISKATGDVLTMSLDKAVYGQSFSGGNLLIGLGLFAATALSASYLAHLPPLEQVWKSGPSIEVGGETISLTQELIKPELQGLAAYGLGEAFGIKDPAALGIGTAAGSFAAPWIEAGTTSLFGHNIYNISPFYQMGSPAFAGSTADSINSQLTGLLGGVVSYAAGHNFSLGQFGGTIVYEHNDQLSQQIEATLTEDGKFAENGYIEGEPGSGVLQTGVNGVAPATAQKLGLSIEEAQQALANFREVNDIGNGSSLPVIITETGEIFAPGGVKDFGNLLDYSVPNSGTGTSTISLASGIQAPESENTADAGGGVTWQAFRSQAQTIQDAVSAEYGNAYAENQGSIRNIALADQNHPITGIPFNSLGFPDFSSVAIKTVEIEYTGTRAGDFAAANLEAGLEETPEGFTWHHVEDGKTMQLVPTEIHRATGHTGGFSLFPQQ